VQCSRPPSPHCLWDYCADTLKGEVPETLMTRSTADISELCEFEWYQWVYFRDQTASFPEEEEVLG
jgi:hypothetical protein